MYKVNFILLGPEGNPSVGDITVLAVSPGAALDALAVNLPRYIVTQLIHVELECSVHPAEGLSYWKKCEGIDRLIDEFLAKHNPATMNPLETSSSGLPLH